MVRYIGIDLAWGEKNTSAAVVLEGVSDNPRDGARVIAFASSLTDDETILRFVEEQDNGQSLLIAIDAPLLVPNQTGRRPCEAILARCMRRAEAAPHPANRNLLAKNGTVRGENLVRRLSTMGVSHTPYLETLSLPVRATFEVFPHPAHIALFDLEKTLKYKAKPDRTREKRLAEFRRYVALLEGLANGEPPLQYPSEPGFWIRHQPDQLPHQALKVFEDTLDALTCAYVAMYRYAWGDERCPVVGDITTGYIVTPANDSMKACFARIAAILAAGGQVEAGDDGTGLASTEESFLTETEDAGETG